jgi:hypothetical protein
MSPISSGHASSSAIRASLSAAVASRIVTVAESYAAMVKERPYRSSMIGYHAMKSILSDNGHQFDPRILKAFLSSAGVFPIGSIVQLNNSAIGRIVSTNAEAPIICRRIRVSRNQSCCYTNAALRHRT